MNKAILELRDVKVHFPGNRSRGAEPNTIKAVDGVSLDVIQGETLGLVGESGCGKSTLGRTIVGVRAPTAGGIVYRPAPDREVDLATLAARQRAAYFREIRMVFQDPQSSLNPRMRVIDLIGEPLRNFGIARGADLRDRVAELLRRVGLRPEYLDRYPHAFSGGERQRLGIARAIATSPRFLVADEAVSALDVSVRAQVINLLAELRSSLDLTYLFISHDLSVVRHVADRVAVMYVGRLVEIGPKGKIFDRPRHPYTEALLSAAPSLDRSRRGADRIRLEGEVADPGRPPPGCAFHPRCRFATERCRLEVPALRALPDGQFAACHHAENLELGGMARAEKPRISTTPDTGAVS